MKILFVTWDLTVGNDANINIAKIIAKKLIKNGHQVFFLGKGNATEEPIYSPDNINYNYVKVNSKNQYIKNKHNYEKKINGKIMSVFNYLRERSKYKKIIEEYIENIESLCKIENINVAIAVSFPFTTSIALASANINSKKVLYQLDPHSGHYKNVKKQRKLKEEINVIKNVDLLFVTRLIYKDNIRNELSSFSHKMHPLDFPNIRKLEIKEEIDKIAFDENYINCVFVGNIYKDIRNPSYMLNVFERMVNKKIVLHCIGGGDIDELYNHQEKLSERLIIYGVVNHNKAINAINDADILINIGNTISNQMPSKIFDYISAGKPMLNFIKIHDCPTIDFTKLYPLCLDILESEFLKDEQVQKIEYFCTEHKGKIIDYSEIDEIYKNHTIDTVYNEFVGKINSLM